MPTSATSFSTGLILSSCSFGLGVLYGNWGYDYNTLWTTSPTDDAFQRSLQHYQVWASMPKFLYHVLHTILALGFIGFFVKLYKPSEANKLFDGGSLFLYVIAVGIYLTNLRKGGAATLDGEWGEVDEKTGVNVIAASQVMIVLILLGVVGLQLGQYWAEWEDEKIAKQAQKEQEKEEKEKEKGQDQKKDQKKDTKKTK